VDLIASWSTALARETSPLEVPLAADIGHRFARGGRERRALLTPVGEDSGGFGGALGPGELAATLDALAGAGRTVLELLDREAIGNVASVAALVVTMLQARRDGSGGPDPSDPSRAPVVSGPAGPAGGPAPTPAVDGGRAVVAVPDPVQPPADVVLALDTAVQEITRRLTAPGRSADRSRDIALRILMLLARDPAGAAAFLRGLEPCLGTDPRAPGRFTGPVPVPAWSWLYLLGLVVGLPGWGRDLKNRYDDYESLSGPAHLGAPVKLLLVAWAVPVALLTVGALTVALPGVRRRWVERRFHLTVRPEGEALAIQEFVDRHSHGVEVMLSGDGGRYARIYPVGLRRARLGVFAPFIRLWQQDRAAAEAVLLHELAHRRQGEHLVLGLGSPLQALLRLWTVLFLAFTILPVAGLFATHDLMAHPFGAQVIVDATGPVRILVFPVAAIWFAEFAADGWAARLHGPGAVLVALGPVDRRPWYRRLLGCVDHPPLRCAGPC